MTLTDGEAGTSSGTRARSTTVLAAGQLVGGRYRLDVLLGAGAMGEVWRARHADLHTDVAIKFPAVPDDPDAGERLLARFRMEAQISAQLGARTRSIVAVHDAGTHLDLPFIVMEHVDGASLDVVLGERGALEPERVMQVVDQVAEALTVAHELGIWHRDVKPANIMVIESPEASSPWRVKLADFGVAKAEQARLVLDTPLKTTAGLVVGTPAYMSPEQLASDNPGFKSDLWSLAVVAYEALTGTEPYPFTSHTQLMLAIMSRPHDPVSLHRPVSATIEAWFERALAKDPDDRFATATEMAETFRDAWGAAVPPGSRSTVPGVGPFRPALSRSRPASEAASLAGVSSAPSAAAEVRTGRPSSRALGGAAGALLGVVLFLGGAAFFWGAPGSYGAGAAVSSAGPDDGPSPASPASPASAAHTASSVPFVTSAEPGGPPSPTGMASVVLTAPAAAPASAPTAGVRTPAPGTATLSPRPPPPRLPPPPPTAANPSETY